MSSFLRDNLLPSDELKLEEDLKSHAYVIGGTRTGKTNLQLFLLNCLYWKRNQSRYPCALIYIDPHGDASLQLANMQENWKDLVILDPMYTTFVLNPLELPPLPELDSPTYKRERIMAVQNQVEQMSIVMREMFSTTSDQAPRLMWLLKGALYYLYAVTDPQNFSPQQNGDCEESSGKFLPHLRPGVPITFLDLYHLLNEMIRMDKTELEKLLKGQTVPDEVVNKTMEAISKLEDTAFASAMNRISNFVLPLASITARTFCKRNGKLDFEDMLKPGRLTIFRIAKSNLPEDFCTMLTNAIVLKIYFTIQSRATKIEEELAGVGASKVTRKNSEKRDPRFLKTPERTPVHIFIDEFQNISNLGILSTILSESAKFGLYLNIAHQNTSQIPEELFNSILGNAGLIFAFRLGPDDARIISKVMAPDEAGWAKSIVRLPNWVSVVRMNPRGSSALARTLTFEVPKARDPVFHSQSIFEFMRSDMELKFGSGDELSSRDREPIYRAALEEAKSANGLPKLKPIEENILYTIHSRATEDRGMKFRRLAEIMRDRFNWNLSLTLTAINSLVDKGYLHDGGIFYDPALVGKSEGDSLGKEEQDKSRETSFVLTDLAKNSFLSREIRGARSGKNIHWNMMRRLIQYYRLSRGFSCTVDYGESKNQLPDIIVYPLKTTLDKEKGTGEGTDVIKEVHDPNVWDVKNRFAIEVETAPRKNKKQLLINYKKSASFPGKYSCVVFYVSSEKHKQDVFDLLRGFPPNTFDVKLLDKEEPRAGAKAVKRPKPGTVPR
jgi:hypothetical protein